MQPNRAVAEAWQQRMRMLCLLPSQLQPVNEEQLAHSRARGRGGTSALRPGSGGVDERTRGLLEKCVWVLRGLG